MTHVVCEPCFDCKYTDCVVVCPAESFYQDEQRLYITPEDPNHCIDCELCVPECPVGAIYRDANVPEQWHEYIAINAERSAALKAAGDGHITEKADPLKGPGCKEKG